MSEMKPDLQAWQTLRTVLADAFKTRADIADLTEFSLATHIDAIPKDGNDTISLISGLLRWCLSHGGNTLQLLLEGALAKRPYHHDLHKIAAQFGVKSSGVKAARRPMRALSPTEREEYRFAAQQLRINYPQIDSFDEQVWKEILAALNLEFNVVTSSGRTDKRKFENLVGTMKQQNRLEELVSLIHKAAIHKLNQEKERDKVIAKFNEAYRQSDWNNVIALSGSLDRLNAHTSATLDNTARAYKTRGTRHLDNRDYSSAIESFTWAIHYSRSRSIQASCYYSRGQAYFALGDYTKALDDFEQAIQRDSSKAVYHYWQGRCYHARKEYSKAIEVYDRLIADEPQADYYYWRGICHFAFGKEDQAITDFRTATAYNPRHAYAFYELGVIYYYRRGDYISAKTFFASAAKWGHPHALKYYIDIKDRYGIS